MYDIILARLSFLNELDFDSRVLVSLIDLFSFQVQVIVKPHV